MRWPTIKIISKNVNIPSDYKFDQLDRDDIAPLMRKLVQWYPGFRVGNEINYLDKRYYKKQVFLKGGNDKRDTNVILLKHFKKIIGFFCIAREPGAKNVYAKMMVIDPDYRGKGFIDLGPEMADFMAKYMNAKIIYGFATLQHVHSQHALEKAGYQLCGILPSFNVELFSHNIRKRVYEAVYVKVLCGAIENAVPRKEDLLSSTAELYEFLFERSQMPAKVFQFRR